MPPKFAKLAGMGALGAIVLFLALYAFIIKLSAPGHYSGIDLTLGVVTWISIGLVVLALAGLHLVIGRQLLSLGKGDHRDTTRATRKD
jgi:hypothetical protein